MARVAGAGLHPAKANLTINGNFELPAVPDSLVSMVPSGEPLAFGWTVNKGDVEVFDGAGSRGISASSDGSQLLDLNGSSVGGMSQAFVTTPGAAYQWTFADASVAVVGLAVPKVGVWNPCAFPDSVGPR